MLTMEDFGVLASSINGILGGNAEQNAQIALSILNGEKGAAREIVIANAACGFWVAGVAKNISEGVVMARQSIDSGAALAKLDALRKLSNGFKNLN